MRNRFLETVRGWFSSRPALPMSTVSALGPSPFRVMSHDGEKFPGGFGSTDLLVTDYWTLRARSAQLFKTNLYGRGLVRRLVTNEINTGLHLEAVPEEALLGYEEDKLSDWAEDVENRFRLWEKDPRLCHHAERMTFGQLQAVARLEALVSGDVLVVLLQDPETMLPRLSLINGACVRSPTRASATGVLSNGNRVVHGVEIDAAGRHVAYWVQKNTSALSFEEPQRLAAFGADTGRRTAWLLYGTDKRMDDVRGEPLLSIVLQSLREINRYRDSVQRKATMNAHVAMFVEKTEDKPGTRPLTAGGAIRRGAETAVDSTGTPRRFNVSEHIPGLVLDELQTGEKPHGFPSTGTDEKFGDFEESIIQLVAWGNEIPPEILRLSFSSNYSASQAAINEFKIFLNKGRMDFGECFCQPIYVEWLLSVALLKEVEAPGLLDSWRDKKRYVQFGAWTAADWTGHIKPAVDLSKLVKGYAEMVEQGFITRDRASRELTGTKYSKNVQKLRRENEQLAAANKAMAALEHPKSEEPTEKEGEDIEVDVDEDDKKERNAA